MPFGPGGTFSAISLPGSFNPAQTGQQATPEAWNLLLADLTAGLSQTITKNGLTTPTANLPLGGFRWTGVGDATARNMFSSAGQVQDSALTFGVVGGTADAITLTLTPAPTAYKIGQTFIAKAVSTNTGAVTIDVNGIGAGPLRWPNGAAVIAGDIVSMAMFAFTVVNTAPAFHLQTVCVNPATTASAAALAAAGRVYVQTFTTSGTYTPHAGLVNCIIECQGAGGGGGGVGVAATSVVAAGGGGAGSRSVRHATAADIGASKAVTIGAAGTAGATGENNGGNGGDTSVGALCIGKGGTGGTGAGVLIAGPGGAGGVAGTGTGTQGTGDAGFAGFGQIGAVSLIGVGGKGGSSVYGSGGISPLGNVGGVATAGNAGTGFGSGGSGAINSSAGGATTAAGGAGTAGYVTITEYCSE